MFFGFHLRHLEQTGEQDKPVPPRQAGQGRNGFCNEDSGLIGAAITGRLVVCRVPNFARGCTSPPAPCLGQDTSIAA